MENSLSEHFLERPLPSNIWSRYCDDTSDVDFLTFRIGHDQEKYWIREVCPQRGADPKDEDELEFLWVSLL